ncbi:MAG: shikimate kinase [Desulfobacula sp.]|nr:shikimate kinase [Desulfobacula sp.]
MNIYLIGYRCTGKTTIGKILADYLHHDYLDVDQVIEQQTGSSISDLVQTHGWEYFRRIEKEILLKTREINDTVVSTGGGIVTDPENLDFLTTAGYTIWLDADIRTILSRLNSDPVTFSSRPSLTDKNLIDETEEFLNLRRPLYAKAAHLKIETGLHTPEEIIALIERRLP